MPPVPRLHTETGNPVNVEAALGAVENEVLKLALEIGLHLQELEPEHLRVDGDRMRAAPGGGRLVDKLTRLGGLLSDGVDGVLDDRSRLPVTGSPKPAHADLPAGQDRHAVVPVPQLVDRDDGALVRPVRRDLDDLELVVLDRIVQVRPGWDVHLWLPLTVVSTS
jgi:hypothetical protein